tara:strand:+ start:441 stop:1199 length:759 start_codon:yes stop_codon:yes gene_type:complete
MFKQSLMIVILLIITYQLYILYFCDNVEKEVPSNQSSEKINSQEQIQNVEIQKPMVYDTPQSFEHPTLGKPTKIIEEGYLFNIENPYPWSSVVFNPNAELKYLFIIKLNLNPQDKNIYNEKINNWYKFIPGIQLNQNNELVIPAPDENSALAITNLVLNNLKGDLHFKNIVENKLIEISLNKIKSYSSIRSKIIEQIMESVYGNQEELNESLDYQEDLAETINTIEEEDVEQTQQNNDYQPLAYEGNEYSFV